MSKKTTRVQVCVSECIKWSLNERENTKTGIGIGRTGRGWKETMKFGLINLDIINQTCHSHTQMEIQNSSWVTIGTALT